ncbi:MAG TPA: hypothetical protein PKC49_08135 [Phycisphaerae bacterium]|nr:hypothetical protein [Phycisphaerae bacterium]
MVPIGICLDASCVMTGTRRRNSRRTSSGASLAITGAPLRTFAVASGSLALIPDSLPTAGSLSAIAAASSRGGGDEALATSDTEAWAVGSAVDTV